MQPFADLGAAVDRRWARAGRALDALPALAAAALAELDPRSLPDPFAIAEQCAAAPTLPDQLAVDFGDAQVTVWRNAHLLVQVIFWLEETTAIHQHGFAGAFRLLRGASLHSTYRFTGGRTVAAGFRVGRLARAVHELLGPGDVRTIDPGDALIHNLVHVEMPSVTLTVRTPFIAALAPQWRFHPPGLAIDRDHPDGAARIPIDLLAACARIDPDRATRIARARIAAGVDASWWTLAALDRRPHTDAELAPYLALVRRRHGAAGRIVAEAFARQRVRARLYRLRRVVRSRPHRTLLALLGDGGDRATILGAIARLHPGEPPTARLERWVIELAPALGLELDRGGARVLRRAVEGAGAAAIAAELRAAQIRGYPVSTVRAVAAAFRSSPLFAPLFR